MLIWNSATDKNQTSFQAQVGGDLEAIGNALVDLWQKVLDELEGCSAENEWDVLICQLVTQCGLAVIFPSRKIIGEMLDASFFVDLTIEAWDVAYQALPDPEEDETNFGRAYDRLHKNQLRALKSAIKDARVKGRFAALKRRHSFAVFCVDEGETPICDRMEFLWGNRPPKRDFASAKELFEHILRKAGLTPEYSMKLQGEKVVAVDWFGHEFEDRFVDLMEAVPDLACVCVDLKEFVLTATRVTPFGVDRLKKLLPGVRFTIVSDQEFENGNLPLE